MAEQILGVVNELLTERGLLLKVGTAMDATLIAAPTSTKNKGKARDPEMHSSKKGNQWYFEVSEKCRNFRQLSLKSHRLSHHVQLLQFDVRCSNLP